MEFSKEKLDNYYKERSEAFKAYEALVQEKNKEVLEIKDSMKDREELFSRRDEIGLKTFELQTIRKESLEVLRDLLVCKDIYMIMGETPPDTEIPVLKSAVRASSFVFRYDATFNKLEEKEKGSIQSSYKILKNSDQFKIMEQHVRETIDNYNKLEEDARKHENQTEGV